jgi:Fe-S cluster assembly protein SufD
MNMVTINGSVIIQDSLENGNFRWILKPYAHATIVHFVDDCNAKLDFIISPSSILYYYPIISGVSVSELTLSVHLQKSAQATINGAYALTHKQQCALITQQNHEQPESHSVLSINGIAADEAFISYHGAISIQKDECKSNAMQENKTLLLGTRSRAISIPSLEVTNNDVQCAHGSAIGPLQEDQLLYAQSRGISLDNARRLLITSFFAKTLEGMLDKKLKETIINKLVAKSLGEM